MRKTRVLFLCAHNSARSQMAEGLLRALGWEKFDYVVTLCDDDAPGSCPFFPGGRHYFHAPFPDPAQGGLEEFRKVRDALRTWIEQIFVKGEPYA